MENKILYQLNQNAAIPQLLKERIQEVIDEDEVYVADELVELCEAILLQLAAYGITAYLMQAKQKSVYNDFLLQLFTTKSHAYNAGPLYRWAANMIKELDTPEAMVLQPMFWEEVDGVTQLNSSVHRLAQLRNEVMHGFFVLPPKRNHIEAEHIASVLNLLVDSHVFSMFSHASFHFLKKENQIVSFSGRWGIQYNEWQELEKAYDFGVLSRKIRHQLSQDFDDEQITWVQKNTSELEINNDIVEFMTTKSQGAMAVWQRPNENVDQEISSLVRYLNQSKEYVPYFLALDADGLSYTSNFILTKLTQIIAKALGVEKYNSDSKKAIKELRKQCTFQPVLVVKDVHLSLFHTDHLLRLADFLYENNIVMICYGVHYVWMDQFFNKSISIDLNSYVPTKNEWLPLLDNYLRFKGPTKEIEHEKKYYDSLLKITENALATITTEKLIVARRFADKHNYPMEYVHEVFSFLYPFLNAGKRKFEEDELDNLYGFPTKITESSRIYFSLGRRDAKLEYQHQTLTL